MVNFAKSKNQLWKESGTTLRFKDWLEREAMKGTIPPKEQLNVAGVDTLDTTQFEDTLGINNADKFEKILGITKEKDDVIDKNKFLGLNKWVLLSSIVLISGAVAYRFYINKKK